MKQLIINKNDLRHNIKKIKEIANLETLDDNGNKYKIIGVVKRKWVWTWINRILKISN